MIFMFCQVKLRASRRLKQQNMRNNENIGHIVRDTHAINSLSLTHKRHTDC